MENYMMNTNDKNLSVTPISDLIEYSRGQIVRLPDFAENQPFYVRLRRPSMLMLAKSGKIPNKLLSTANDLFMGNTSSEEGYDENFLNNMYEVIDTIVEASLVEPSYDDLKKNGIELTDQQLLAIFNYTQEGVNSLDSFRK